MFKGFQCPENTDKALSVQYFSPDRPKITKVLMVELSRKKINLNNKWNVKASNLFAAFLFFLPSISVFVSINAINCFSNIRYAQTIISR